MLEPVSRNQTAGWVNRDGLARRTADGVEVTFGGSEAFKTGLLRGLRLVEGALEQNGEILTGLPAQAAVWVIARLGREAAPGDRITLPPRVSQIIAQNRDAPRAVVELAGRLFKDGRTLSVNAAARKEWAQAKKSLEHQGPVVGAPAIGHNRVKISRAVKESIAPIPGIATGRALASIVAAPAEMGMSSYARTVELEPTQRARIGVFAQSTTRALSQVRKLEERLEGAAVAERSHLESLIALSLSIATLYETLATSHSSDPEADAAQGLERIADAYRSLQSVPRGMIGKDAFMEMEIHLRGLAEVLLAVPEMRKHGVVGAVDVFVLQAHRRLQQLADGARSRESVSYSGAIDTFRNDAADGAMFRNRFARIDQDLTTGRFATAGELQAAMLDAVTGTSESFRGSVSKLAAVRWVASEAALRGQAANQGFVQAKHVLSKAFEALAYAEADLGIADQHTRLSEHALSTPPLAREALELADELRGQAETHLGRYRTLMAESAGDRNNAVKQLEVARALNRSVAALLDLVDAGPSDPTIDAELRALRVLNATQERSFVDLSPELLANADWVNEGANAIEDLSSRLGGIISQLDTTTSLRELEESLGLHLDDAVQRLHRVIDESLTDVELSDRARAYVRDPSGAAAGIRANVRAELTAAFETHPFIAGQLAKAITSARSSFSSLRDAAGGEHVSSAEVHAINTAEHGLLSMWLERDGVVVEALLRAELRGAAPALARAELARWSSEVQGRYGQSLLLDAERAAESAHQWHQWMTNEAPELGERYQELVSGYGDPVEHVPLTLHAESSGRLTVFNAYLFRDGQRWKAFNSIDGRVYSGSSRDEAIRHLGDEAELGRGELSVFLDGDITRFPSRELPTGSLAADISMGVVGGAGGVLLLTPEPTTLSMWGGGALMAMSSTYFVAKGTAALVDLIEHETAGFNLETTAAALDVASGLLMGLRGAGILASTAKSQSFIQARLAQLGTAAGLDAAELTVGAVGVGLAAKGLNDIYRDDRLSDGEKIHAATEMLAATLIPMLAVGGFSRIAKLQRGRAEGHRLAATDGRRASLGRLHLRTLDQVLETMYMNDSLKSDRARKLWRTSAQEVYTRGKALYASEIFDSHPNLRVEGEHALDTLRLNVERTEPESGRLQSSLEVNDPDRIHSVDDMIGYRRTVGWSGEVAADAPPSMPHLSAIHLGRERISPGRLARLDATIEQATTGSAKSNDRIDALEANRATLYRRLEAIKRAGQDPTSVLESIRRVDHEWEFAITQRSAQMRADRTQAVRQMRALRSELMGPEGPARAKAEALAIDASVRDPQRVRDVATLFFRLTGDALDPSKITVQQREGRGFAEPAGILDIGRGEDATLMHELGHFVEFGDPAIYRAGQSWKQARAIASKGMPSVKGLRELTDRSYGDHEIALEDEFENPYVGKEYSFFATEVFTMGVETMASPESMLELYTKDPEHFFLTISLLRTEAP